MICEVFHDVAEELACKETARRNELNGDSSRDNREGTDAKEMWF